MYRLHQRATRGFRIRVCRRDWYEASAELMVATAFHGSAGRQPPNRTALLTSINR